MNPRVKQAYLGAVIPGIKIGKVLLFSTYFKS